MIPPLMLARGLGAARALLPWLLGALVLVALFFGVRAWSNARFDAGVKQGRAACEAAAAEAARIQERADRARVDGAAVQLARRADAGAAATIREIDRVEIRWRDRPAVVCIDDGGVHEIEQSRAAIRAATTAGGDAAVPDGEPAGAADR